MSVSVGDKFRDFIDRISPTDRELEKANYRANRIKNRLEEDFDTKRVFVAGSHWKGTAVRWYSDVDLFVVMSQEEASKWAPNNNSFTLMRRVRNSVLTTFPNNLIRMDRQAVVARFEQGDYSVDVVPAIFDRIDSQTKSPIYSIPDGSGKWKITSPDYQKKIIDSHQNSSGNKFKSLAKILKWWGSCRQSTSTLSSLYVENLIMACNIPLRLTYQESVLKIFEFMSINKLPRIDDPSGFSNQIIKPMKRDSQTDDTKNMVNICHKRAIRASEFEGRENHKNSIILWKSIFNGNGF